MVDFTGQLGNRGLLVNENIQAGPSSPITEERIANNIQGIIKRNKDPNVPIGTKMNHSGELEKLRQKYPQVCSREEFREDIVVIISSKENTS